MPSPFPGMDPYLEQPAIWSDLHLTLIVAMRAELNAQLPRGYLAAADRHVWIEDQDEETQRVVGPDIFVAESESPAGARATEAAAVGIIPRTVSLPLRERKGSPFLKILDAQDRRVITVLEILSPANKLAGGDRNAYLAKREEYLAANVNLVEINLLRAGKSPPLGKARLARSAYYYLVCRAEDLPEGELWTFTVRDAMPPVPVPLRGKESIALNLRSCLDRAYDEARYGEEIDYSSPPQPALSDADTRWSREILTNTKRLH